MSYCALLSRNARVGFLMRVNVLVTGGDEVILISCLSSFFFIPLSAADGTKLSSDEIGGDSN